MRKFNSLAYIQTEAVLNVIKVETCEGKSDGTGTNLHQFNMCSLFGRTVCGRAAMCR